MVYKGSTFLKLEDNMWHQFIADSTLTGVASLSLYYNKNQWIRKIWGITYSFELLGVKDC